MRADQDFPPKTSGLTANQLRSIVEQAHLLATEGSKGDKIELVLGGKGQLYINRFARVKPEDVNSPP